MTRALALLCCRSCRARSPPLLSPARQSCPLRQQQRCQPNGLSLPRFPLVSHCLPLSAAPHWRWLPFLLPFPAAGRSASYCWFPLHLAPLFAQRQRCRHLSSLVEMAAWCRCQTCRQDSREGTGTPAPGRVKGLFAHAHRPIPLRIVRHHLL